MNVTKDFLKDFRAADSIVFRVSPKESDYPNVGTVQIECIKKETKKGEWIRPEIRIDHNGFPAYYHYINPHNYAFVESYADYGAVGALKLLLRDGDDVSFEFWNNSSKMTKEAGILNLGLFVNIRRNGKQIIHNFQILNDLRHV